jgi:hypothetical protein
MSLKLENNEKVQLQGFLAQLFQQEAQNLTDFHKHMLRMLPIYETLEKFTQSPEPKLTSLLPPNLFLPCDLGFPIFGSNFLKCSNENDKNLLEFLGVKTISKTKFLMSYIFPEMSSIPADIRDGLMVHVLKSFDALQKESPEFLQAFCETKFVPTKGGMLKAPNQVSKSIFIVC